MDRYFTSTRRLPSLLADDSAARQAARAEQIGVPWPPDLKRKQGKLGHERAWIQKVQRHILDDLDLPEWVTANKPAWWHPGMAFAQPTLDTSDVLTFLILSACSSAFLIDSAFLTLSGNLLLSNSGLGKD
eukprot:5014338-Amphidinium_carterae.1